MDLSEGDARRYHPFGRAANLLVLGGASLSIIQSAVSALAGFAAPANEGFELRGGALLIWVLASSGLPLAIGWTALRALRSWWRRSVRVVPQLLLAGLLAMPSTVLLRVPLGDELLTPVGYLPAGLALVVAAFLARPRVVRARAEGRGGLGD
jgi:hypothetical protein